MASPYPVDVAVNPNLMPQVRTKSWTTSLLLLVFLGGFSAHRFYNGKVGTAILQLLTLGVSMGIGVEIFSLVELQSSNAGIYLLGYSFKSRQSSHDHASEKYERVIPFM